MEKRRFFFPIGDWVFPKQSKARDGDCDENCDGDSERPQERPQEGHRKATGRPKEGHRKATGFSPNTGRRRGKLEAGGILYI